LCGRFALYHSASSLGPIFNLAPSDLPSFQPRYNIAPNHQVPVIFSDQNGRRVSCISSWGLIPHWADPTRFKAKLFNARSETAADKPAFRDAMRMGRCLIPASGFFEWKFGAKPKRPYFVRRIDDQPIAFAGLWSLNPGLGTAAFTHTILTTRSNQLMSALHHRMPVILKADQYSKWLDPSIRKSHLLTDLFAPYSDMDLKAFPVPRKVGNPSFDDPSLVQTLAFGARDST
jgi:putative SOS response-associated peptidase YedK